MNFENYLQVGLILATLKAGKIHKMKILRKFIERILQVGTDIALYQLTPCQKGENQVSNFVEK